MRQRFVQVNGELVQVSRDWTADPVADYHVMGDISPYRSMVNGEWITSRSRHREHLREHGLSSNNEVGNDPSYLNARPQPRQSPPGLKDTIIRVANEKLRRI